jgi:hypothetical protein
MSFESSMIDAISPDRPNATIVVSSSIDTATTSSSTTTPLDAASSAETPTPAAQEIHVPFVTFPSMKPVGVTNGAYLVADASRGLKGVFKPREEEAHASALASDGGGGGGASVADDADANALVVHDAANPNLAELRALRNGCVWGDTPLKEVAAFALDHEGFAGVPRTIIAHVDMTPLGGVVTLSRSSTARLAENTEDDSDGADGDAAAREGALTTTTTTATSSTAAASASSSSAAARRPSLITQTTALAAAALTGTAVAAGIRELTIDVDNNDNNNNNNNSNNNKDTKDNSNGDNDDKTDGDDATFAMERSRSVPQMADAAAMAAATRAEVTAAEAGAADKGATGNASSSSSSSPSSSSSSSPPPSSKSTSSSSSSPPPRFKFGSVQAWKEHATSAEDIGSGIFPVSQVQRIGILDIRIVNLDRHMGNILVAMNGEGDATSHAAAAAGGGGGGGGGGGANGDATKTKGNGITLIPIDHGYILPDFRKISDVNFEWMWWPQAKLPLGPVEASYVRRLNAFHDAHMLQTLGIRNESIMSCILSTLLLQRSCAAGLTLFDVASMIQRPGFGDQPSTLEKLISRVWRRRKTKRSARRVGYDGNADDGGSGGGGGGGGDKDDGEDGGSETDTLSDSGSGSGSDDGGVGGGGDSDAATATQRARSRDRIFKILLQAARGGGGGDGGDGDDIGGDGGDGSVDSDEEASDGSDGDVTDAAKPAAAAATSNAAAATAAAAASSSSSSSADDDEDVTSPNNSAQNRQRIRFTLDTHALTRSSSGSEWFEAEWFLRELSFVVAMMDDEIELVISTKKAKAAATAAARK